MNDTPKTLQKSAQKKPQRAPQAGRDTQVYKDLLDQPGHLFRRGEQICVSAFYEALGSDVTPMQYGVLRMVHEHPGLDQVSLARALALDTSTTAEIATRLERKGLLHRELQIVMRRQRLLYLTEEGDVVLTKVVQGVEALKGSLLSRLEPQEQKDLMRLLRRFVEVNGERSDVPSKGPDSASPLKAPPHKPKRSTKGAATS